MSFRVKAEPGPSLSSVFSISREPMQTQIAGRWSGQGVCWNTR
jgi:hypothetical protein